MAKLNDDNQIGIVKLFENATMNEIKFIEAKLINSSKFCGLLNINKELKELKRYKLNKEQHQEFDRLMFEELEESTTATSTKNTKEDASKITQNKLNY